MVWAGSAPAHNSDRICLDEIELAALRRVKRSPSIGRYISVLHEQVRLGQRKVGRRTRLLSV